MLIDATPLSLFVSGTIWGALILYVVGEFGRSLRPSPPWTRPLWILGSACYICHVISAFSLHHNWSHSAAYAYTAATTYDLLGINSRAHALPSHRHCTALGRRGLPIGQAPNDLRHHSGAEPIQPQVTQGPLVGPTHPHQYAG